LEDDNHLPIPFAEASTTSDVLLAAVVDPDLKPSAFVSMDSDMVIALTANKRADTVERLP
jgi:hypothetical protein